MKEYLKRVLAALLVVIIVVGVLPATGLVKPVVRTATAAGGVPEWSSEEFGKCYAKVLLSQVGKGYGESGGYNVGGTYYGSQASRVTTGTPYSPSDLSANTYYDCYGLVISCLMAMGYTSFGRA